jgi:hypothetical protein
MIRPWPQDWRARFTKKFVGWGAHYIDFDNDGNLDLLIVMATSTKPESTRMDVKIQRAPCRLETMENGVPGCARERAGKVFQSNYSARGLVIMIEQCDGA